MRNKIDKAFWAKNAIKKYCGMIFLIFVFIIFYVCFLKGKYTINTVDFIPINGDFQNYNGFRRLLQGQVPFKDFVFYLGLGPLYFNSIFLYFSNNFASSMFITTFLTAIMFCISIFLISFLVLKNKFLSILITVFIQLIILFQNKIESILLSISPILNNYYKIFFTQFSDYFSKGNSLRMQRSFIIFLLIFVVLVLIKFKTSKYFIKLWNAPLYIKSILIAISTTLTIFWSNDFGISSFISITIVFIIWLISKKNILALIKCTSIYFIVSIISGFAFINILTLGNGVNWIKNSLDVSNYQFWYYGTSIKDKYLFLKDIFISEYTPIIFCSIFLLIFYTIKILLNKYSKNELLILYLLLSSFIAGFIYAVKSGGFLFGTMIIILLSLIIANFVRLIMYIIKKSKLITTFPIIALISIIPISAVLFFSAKYLFIGVNKIDKIHYISDNSIYIEELNGKLNVYGESLNKTKKKLGTEKVFSTYASALEVITNQYQPSGVDYVIHVLGDKSRENYLSNFNTGNYKYASTIREDFTFHEIWIKKANWFFYRELYKNYSPSFLTYYSVIWEKTKINKLPIDKVTTSITKKDNTSTEITVNSGDNKSYTADLKISYESNWTINRFTDLAINKIVGVFEDYKYNDYFECYFIPPKSKEYYVPLKIVNGKGKITIKSIPDSCTTLIVTDAKVENLFDDSKYYNLLQGGQ